MKFAVHFRKQETPRLRTYPHVILDQDAWDDYGYQTTFHATLHLARGTEVDLGNVKILNKDQKGDYTPLPDHPFESLGADYCSLGGKLDYYEELFKQGKAIYRAYLEGLRDVTFNDDILAQFEDFEGFKVSLLRFSGAERTIADAAKLFRTEKPTTRRRSAGFKVKFKTRVARAANTFTIDLDFRKRGSLPNRINVLIGYNGTGKTRLLSNLAIVASGFGYSRKEDVLDNTAGRFVSSQPPFKSVIVVSYSAFDTFVIPGRTDEEKERLQEEGTIFGYVYCGLREREEANRSNRYRLKTPQEIEDEFLAVLKRVRNADRQDVLLEVLRPLLRDASFQRIGLTQLYANTDDEGISKLFRELSSGHKVVLKIVTELIAFIDGEQPSLVLIDEPESHLHPPLLAALLKSVKAVLERFDGYAVIATHSPVVLQETPARVVRVLRRIVNQSRIVAPAIETFGESIGVITQHVFNLDDGSTDWHETLRDLAERHDLREIEEMFEKPLGFAPRSYVISTRDQNED